MVEDEGAVGREDGAAGPRIFTGARRRGQSWHCTSGGRELNSDRTASSSSSFWVTFSQASVIVRVSPCVPLGPGVPHAAGLAGHGYPWHRVSAGGRGGVARGDGAGRVSKARRALLSAVWSPRPCSCNCAGLRQPRARPRTARAAPSPLALPAMPPFPGADTPGDSPSCSHSHVLVFPPSPALTPRSFLPYASLFSRVLPIFLTHPYTCSPLPLPSLIPRHHHSLILSCLSLPPLMSLSHLHHVSVHCIFSYLHHVFCPSPLFLTCPTEYNKLQS